MRVSVVNVRVMRMLVSLRRVLMRVLMCCMVIPTVIMFVLVVLVMVVQVRVFNRFVGVGVFVVFCQMQPDTQPHQRTGHPEGRTGWLRQQNKCNARADERCDREISTRSRGAKPTQCEHKENQACAITDQPDEHRYEYGAGIR